METFADRQEAGQLLAATLRNEADIDVAPPVVLALPRGGVPVGYEIAMALGAPLSVFIVRKLGVPGHSELAMGAIASGGVRVLNDDVVRMLQIPETAIEQVARAEEIELARRERLYGGAPEPSSISGRITILVDDGLATGSTMKAAVLAVRRLDPRRLLVAVPVGAPDTCEAISELADRVVCLRMPEPFQAVGLWYRNFRQTTDDEVRALLHAAANRTAPMR
jgi:predicted phosphoribosyltransferase